MNILALDISKASCGIAMGDGNGPPRTARATFAGDRGHVFASYREWLLRMLVLERPDLVANEAALIVMDKNSSADVARLMVGMASVTEEICAKRAILHVDVHAGSWRKAFLGKGNLKRDDAKRLAVAECARLGWPTDGNHDRAEACGVWCWAHLYRGNQRGMHRLLSASSMRSMRAG